ncbi:MAG: hypothetical protein KAI70_02675 [Candidatus Omnitrophica bacterium]|nr:hypothetical protein [Candidatus Omnitrophota bacterium]
MSYRCKIFFVSAVLLAQILGNFGCAALWFVAGVGTAATVVAISEENKKQTFEEVDEELE